MKTLQMYPYCGKHYLLQYHTHNEGNHIILSKNKNSIDVAFKHIVALHPDIVEYCSINIVSPSNKMYSDYSEYEFKSAMDQFWCYNCSIANEYYRKYDILPGAFSLCPNRAEDDYHYCDDCKCSMIINVDEEKFFLNTLSSRYEMVKQLPVFHNATEIDLDKHLYAAIKDFGHHSRGLSIHECVDETEDLDKVFFLFQDKTDLDATIYRNKIKESIKSNQQIRIKYFEENKKKIEEQEKQNLKKFVEMFSKYREKMYP